MYGRKVVVSLSFVEADVKRPILSSAKMGEAGLMARAGPTWSGPVAVQDVALRPDAAWLPLVKEGSCYELDRKSGSQLKHCASRA